MNNMGKGLGVVITGVVFSVVGLALAGACAKAAYDDFKDNSNYVQGEFKLNDSKKITIEASEGTLNLHHSTTSESYVKYNVLEYCKVKYDEEENKIELRRKWRWGLVLFTWYKENKSTVDVYLTDDDYDAYLELNAGKFNVDSDFNFNTLTIDVSAGEFNFNGDINVKDDAYFKISAGDLNLNGSVKVEDEAKLKVSAGDMEVKYLEANKVTSNVSAGDMTITKVKSDDIYFKISAGDINMNILGDKADYKIKIEESAGSCYINDKSTKGDYEKEEGTKNLEGHLSAGSAKINFVESN